MFDIGFTEIIIICLVGLIVIGPSRLPEALRTGAMWIGRGKRMLSNVRRDLENEIGIDEIRRDLRNEQIMAEIKAENLEEERERQQAPAEKDGEAKSESQPEPRPVASKKRPHTNSYLDSANKNGESSPAPQSEIVSSADTDSHPAEQNKKNS